MDTGTKRLTITSDPADATSPARVSSSGSPAATSAPKARTRMARVTGHENSSEVSIALRLASLKSAQSCDAPVGVTCTLADDSASSGERRSRAARTMLSVEAPAPPRTTAVVPSRLRVAPGWGGTTAAMRGSAPNSFSTRCTVWAPAPLVTLPLVVWTTTWSAEPALPPKCFRASSRTWTDWEPSACQPAPDSECSTLGASSPSPSTRMTQIAAVSLPWPMTARLSRPSGP